MTITSFGKILTVLDLFSISRPVIDVDIISEELQVSKPTSYRYLKELVSADLLQRMSGTSGEYTLGPKIAVLDYIERTTDPLIQISLPFMKKVVEKTELDCLISFLNHDYCIDLHHQPFKSGTLPTYGRGSPRPVYIGSSPKIIASHLTKNALTHFYKRYSTELAKVDFSNDEISFFQKMRRIKKQGYYFSQGEINPMYSSLSVPIKYSSKCMPLSLTVVGSKNRFEYLDLEKIIATLQECAIEIETEYQATAIKKANP